MLAEIQDETFETIVKLSSVGGGGGNGSGGGTGQQISYTAGALTKTGDCLIWVAVALGVLLIALVVALIVIVRKNNKNKGNKN